MAGSQTTGQILSLMKSALNLSFVVQIVKDYFLFLHQFSPTFYICVSVRLLVKIKDVDADIKQKVGKTRSITGIIIFLLTVMTWIFSVEQLSFLYMNGRLNKLWYIISLNLIPKKPYSSSE